MLFHMLCPYVVPGCPHKHQSPDGARSAEAWEYASLAPIRWIGVFCHHSCREAVLRGLTSASRQANAQIVMFSCHEADLGWLTSASRQIPISVPRQVPISASRQIFIRHSTVLLSCAFCNKRLDHEISMQALHCEYLQALNKCEENVIGFPRILYIPTIMTRYL